jgi:hypothetical protein
MNLIGFSHHSKRSNPERARFGHVMRLRMKQKRVNLLFSKKLWLHLRSLLLRPFNSPFNKFIRDRWKKSGGPRWLKYVRPFILHLGYTRDEIPISFNPQNYNIPAIFPNYYGYVVNTMDGTGSPSSGRAVLVMGRVMPMGMAISLGNTS